MKIWETLLDLLYPRRCVFCHKLIETDDPLCRDCRRKLTALSGERHKRNVAMTAGCYAPLYYEGDVRNSLLRYKFQGQSVYAEVYGEFLSKCIDENKISCDIITWVPLSRRRLRSRGYDQAGLLAEEAAERIGKPCVPLLKKLRNNPAQSRTGNAARRKANVAGIYTAINPEQFQGKCVLLVDDIMTTGATLAEAAKTLKAAGAGEIICLTLAQKRE